jgi:hypothetical protein
MNERDKRWWLQPLSYGYVGPQAAPTGLLQQQTVPATEPAIGLTQAAVPTYQPISAPFTQPQWNTEAVTLPTTAVNTLENQAIAAYQALPAATPIAEPTVTIGLSNVTQPEGAETLAIDPTFGLAATDPNLQGLTPFSTASTTMTPAQINAGMAEVDLPYFSRFPFAQKARTQGEFDFIEHADATFGGASQESTKDTAGRMLWKDVAEDLPNWFISTVLKSGVPFSNFTGDNIETATTAESIKDALANIVIMDAKKSGIPKDDLIASVLSGANTLIHTDANQLTAAEDYVSKGGKLDRDDARQMAFQVDEFLGTIPATTPSTISKVSRPSTKKAAIGTKKNEAEEAEKARMRALAKQQAAAQRKQDIAKAKAAKAQEAMVQAALERAAQAQAERAMVDRAKAIMDKYAGRRESPENYMSADERNIVAAANVDTFAGVGDRSGEVREAMRSVGYGGSNWT